MAHLERYRGCCRDQGWFNGARSTKTSAQCGTIALDSSGVDSPEVDFSRNGILVRTSSPHRTSNQYSPGSADGRVNCIRRFAPCSPPENTTGHLRTGDGPLSGLFSLIPISCSPITSPDFNITKAVMGSPSEGASFGTSICKSPGPMALMPTDIVSTMRIRLTTLSGSMRTFSQMQATCTKGLGLDTHASDHRFLLHRAATALRAIALRFAGESAAARACPPFDAPSFDRATAAGLRPSGISAGLGACPVAS